MSMMCRSPRKRPITGSTEAQALQIVDLTRDRGDQHHGRLAGIEVESELPFFLLQPRAGARVRAGCPAQWPAPAAFATVSGVLLDRPIELQLAHTDQGSWLSFTDGSMLEVDKAGSLIRIHAAGTELELLVFGPALILALARRGIYCVHASAFISPRQQRPWLALAASGTGKSTLARCVLAAGGTRLADDLCALRLIEGRLQLLPRFPQLKLAAALHWPQTATAAVEITGLAQLARGPRCRVQPIPDALALALLVVHHTVASRLFAPGMLATHLQFASAAAQWLLAQRGACIATTAERPEDIEGAMLELLTALELHA